MTDWTETVDDRGSHELHRGRWTLVAWPDGGWEVRLCGGHVDDGMAPLPTLDNAKAAALARAAELASGLAAVPAVRWAEIHGRTRSEAVAAVGPWTLRAERAERPDGVTVVGWDLCLDAGGDNPVLVRTISVPDVAPEEPPTLAELEAAAVAALRSLGVAVREEAAP